MPPPRYDRTPEPIFRGTKASVRDNKRLLEQGHDKHFMPGGWLKGVAGNFGETSEASMGLNGHRARYGHAKPLIPSGRWSR